MSVFPVVGVADPVADVVGVVGILGVVLLLWCHCGGFVAVLSVSSWGSCSKV
jgi:hypothetical protein